MVRVVVVTATRQAETWLDDCLASVLLQPGDFTLCHHVQDGGSTDQTLAIVERWQRRLAEDPGLIRCRGVSLTLASAADGGLYDALARGFESLDPGPDDVMTWLNADDLLAPGAIQTAVSWMSERPDVRLCGGRAAEIDAKGRISRLHPLVPISRAALARGDHDGRRRPFIMQEGTFWRGDLWTEVGGVDGRFRLAGDWDLWRRMALSADYVTLDTVTAFHRRRSGQLSEDLDAYFAEIDAARDQNPTPDIVGEPGRVGRLASGGQAEASLEPVRPAPLPEQLTPQARSVAVPFSWGQGMGEPEGPYPEYGLPAGIRWMTAEAVPLTVQAREDGPHDLELDLRTGELPLSVAVWQGADAVIAADLAAAPHLTQRLAARFRPNGEPLWLRLKADQPLPRLKLLVEAARIWGPPQPRERVHAADGDWEPLSGFGEMEPPRPDVGLSAPFRWVEASPARIRIHSAAGGLRPLHLRWRSLVPGQRLMVRTEGRTWMESEPASGDLARAQTTTGPIRLEPGWTTLELRFGSLPQIDGRTLAAVLETVTLGPDGLAGMDSPPDRPGGWRWIDGQEFEETPAPELGLSKPFRWMRTEALIELSTPGGPGLLTLGYRAVDETQVVRVETSAAALGASRAGPGGLATVRRFTAPLTPSGPTSLLRLSVSPGFTERGLGIIIEDVSFEPS